MRTVEYESPKEYAFCPGWPSGGHKSTPVKHKLFPPSLQLPTYNGSYAWQLAGPVHETGCPKQNSLSGTISFCLQGCYVSATSQDRLNSVLGRTSIYETFLARKATKDTVHRVENSYRTNAPFAPPHDNYVSRSSVDFLFYLHPCVGVFHPSNLPPVKRPVFSPIVRKIVFNIW